MASEAERARACRERAAALKRFATTVDNATMREEIARLAEQWNLAADRAERRAKRQGRSRRNPDGDGACRSELSDSLALTKAAARRRNGG